MFSFILNSLIKNLAPYVFCIVLVNTAISDSKSKLRLNSEKAFAPRAISVPDLQVINNAQQYCWIYTPRLWARLFLKLMLILVISRLICPSGRIVRWINQSLNQSEKILTIERAAINFSFNAGWFVIAWIFTWFVVVTPVKILLFIAMYELATQILTAILYYLMWF